MKDYVERQKGITNGALGGAIMVNGRYVCPFTPMDLLEATEWWDRGELMLLVLFTSMWVIIPQPVTHSTESKSFSAATQHSTTGRIQIRGTTRHDAAVVGYTQGHSRG